jgi:hypothetical protein
VYPAVTTLPEPFPRGLPIQYLTAPWCLTVQDLEEHAPYVAACVEKALFPDPARALQVAPSDDESKGAIGVFVDVYQHALILYASKACK